MNFQNETTIETIVVTVSDKLGFHMRTAARFVECVRQYRSAIFIRKGQATVDGKSILSLLALGAGWNAVLQIEAVGGDARQAIEGIQSFFSA